MQRVLTSFAVLDSHGRCSELPWPHRGQILSRDCRGEPVKPSPEYLHQDHNADKHVQSGFFPAATYLLTLWYLRYEVQSRMAVFYAGASLSGAFSGLLAYAIEKMDGIGGLAGWRW